MSNILKLVILDKALLKPYYKYFFVIIFAPVIVAFSYKNIISSILFAIVMVSMTSNYTFSICEKNDLNRLYGLLPVSKKDIVMGRYLFTALLGVSAVVVFTVLNYLIFTATKTAFALDELVYGISIGIIFYFLFTGIQLPAYFKFGSIKGRVFAFLPFIGLFIVGYIADKADFVSNNSMFAVLNNPYAMVVISLLIAVILYCISIGITLKIYDNQEL